MQVHSLSPINPIAAYLGSVEDLAKTIKCLSSSQIRWGSLKSMPCFL